MSVKSITISMLVVIVVVALVTVHRPNHQIIPVVWAAIGAASLGAILLFLLSIARTNHGQSSWPSLILAFLLAVFVMAALSTGSGYVSTQPAKPTPTASYKVG